MTLRDAITQIQRFNGRLSGSRVYGEPREDSDWDFWMPERQVRRLRKWLDNNREPWDSPFLGSITFYPQMVQVEVSYLFPRNRKQHEAQALVRCRRAELARRRQEERRADDEYFHFGTRYPGQ